MNYRLIGSYARRCASVLSSGARDNRRKNPTGALLLAAAAAFLQVAQAQTSDPAKDVVYLASGDRNTGRIVSVSADKLVLETANAGAITFSGDPAWDHVVVDGKEFSFSALAELNAALAKRVPAPASVSAPDPPASETDKPAAPAKRPFLKQISGTMGLGISLQQATASTRGLSADANLYRASLDKVGKAPHNETGLIFNQQFSRFIPKTGATQSSESFTVDLSQAHRITGKFSVFGEAAYDHVSSDGLNLMQIYGAGLGYTAWNDGTNRFELRGGFAYIDKSFEEKKLSHTLDAFLFEEQYAKVFKSGMAIRQQYKFEEGFQHYQDVEAQGNLALDMPISSIFAMRFAVNHRYLNILPKGDKRNSFEATVGLDVTLNGGKTATGKAKRRNKKKKR